jgi:hypothetical protein
VQRKWERSTYPSLVKRDATLAQTVQERRQQPARQLILDTSLTVAA